MMDFDRNVVTSIILKITDFTHYQYLLQREIQNIVGHEQEVNFCPEVIKLFNQHPWPGNIRQFINVVRATLYTAGEDNIVLHDLPVDFMDEWRQYCLEDNNPELISESIDQLGAMSLADWEMHGIKTALNECEGNISLASKKLGITRTTLYKKIERFGLRKTKKSAIYV